MKFGMIASTDTHNATPGNIDEQNFMGHRGTDDATDADRLGSHGLTAGGVDYSPGGLVAVWAEENSRPAIFDALHRREAYGTSGPRIALRVFGGWDLGADLCASADLVTQGYARGVPMGGDLPAQPAGAGAPTIVISAARDPGTAARPSVALDRIQIIKGWVASDGPHERVFDVVSGAPGATVDRATCAASGGGADTLCASFTDPNFDPSEPAYYYVRVLENPTCRWSTWACARLAPADRPPSCSDPNVPTTVQERAWSSPIWYSP
jgi:hypothetical protein